ncbi:MAG: hypothetical protein JWR37_2658 [Mycobacterium sp.]|nr:hypothetical protein [Mycobacterium sp.]
MQVAVCLSEAESALNVNDRAQGVILAGQDLEPIDFYPMFIKPINSSEISVKVREIPIAAPSHEHMYIRKGFQSRQVQPRATAIVVNQNYTSRTTSAY